MLSERRDPNMETQQYRIRNVLLTFIIGFVAGTTPFVFMKLLPMMLHPELYTAESSNVMIMLLGVILTGCIIGVITSLMFAGDGEKKDPKEIFVYALGIPAILIATVSGLMTDVNAMQKISMVQAGASASILSSQPATQSIPDVRTNSVDQSSSTDKGRSLLLGSAWAGDRPRYQLATNGKPPFIVVIGTYTDRVNADDAFNKFNQRRFKTESYIPKQLELRTLDVKPIQYIIIYNRFNDQVDAQRASHLLKINDPDLNISIMRDLQH